MGAEWDSALASPMPVVISVRTDPELPPSPPHITFEEAKQFMHALQQGSKAVSTSLTCSGTRRLSSWRR